MTFAGAVLCGGASRRMGQDKALLRIDGLALAARVAAALRDAGATDVVAVGGDDARLTGLGLVAVPDDDPGAGPLPATLTALRWWDRHGSPPLIAVLSCDLLEPGAPAILRTVDALAEAPGAVGAIPVAAGIRQWTHAVWRARALAPLEDAWAAGGRSLRGAATGLDLVDVTDLDPRHLADADHPADLPGHGGGGPSRAG